MPRKSLSKKTAKKTTAKKTTAKKRGKKPAKEMTFADGRVDEEHKLACDIEEILGTTPSNPFGTTSIDSLEAQLSEMNITQMQELAVKASVFPSGNRTTLKNKLKKDFTQKYGISGESSKYIAQAEKPVIAPESNLAEEIRKILDAQ